MHQFNHIKSLLTLDNDFGYLNNSRNVYLLCFILIYQQQRLRHAQ